MAIVNAVRACVRVHAFFWASAAAWLRWALAPACRCRCAPPWRRRRRLLQSTTACGSQWGHGSAVAFWESSSDYGRRRVVPLPPLGQRGFRVSYICAG
jgi:hypothetical protein